MGRPVRQPGLVLLGVVVVAGLFWVGRLRLADANGTAGGEAVAPPNRLRSAPGPYGDEAAIVLDDTARARAGIATQVLGRAMGVDHLRLTGQLVANPALVITIQAPLAGRLVAAAGRWPALGDPVVAGAALGQVSDARPLIAARSGTVTRVSAQPGELVQAGQQLLQITDFSQPLARIVWDDAAPLPAPRVLALAPVWAAATSRAGSVDARLVGLAPAVDSLTRAPVYLYRLVRPWAAARPGAPVVALVPEARPAVRGVLVPNAAVVQWQALAWAYVQHGPSSFVRVRIDTTHPVPGGWIVTAGVAPGDTVVVTGAQILLSEEFRSRVSVGEDEDKR